MATFDNTTVGSDVAPSYSPSIKYENDIIEVSLGDGYAQRLRKGLNSTRRTINLEFNNRDKTTTDNILAFLEDPTKGDGGAKAFTYNPPYGTSGKFTCQNPSVELASANLYNISLVFKEVFEV